MRWTADASASRATVVEASAFANGFEADLAAARMASTRGDGRLRSQSQPLLITGAARNAHLLSSPNDDARVSQREKKASSSHVKLVRPFLHRLARSASGVSKASRYAMRTAAFFSDLYEAMADLSARVRSVTRVARDEAYLVKCLYRSIER